MRFSRVAFTVITVLSLLGPAGTLGPAIPAEAQEKPRPGGVLTWFDYGDPGRLDVHAESPLVVQQATAGIWSGLLHYDPDNPSKIAGDLAERWTISPDGKTYTFHLRKGVKWHDGQPFSAADVKVSFDRILNPEFQSPKCGASLKPLVQSVEMPFRFKKYERGSVIEWEKNPNYFIPGLPYLDGVKQFILVGGPTQLAAAKAAKVMLWDAWPPMRKTQAEELRRARDDVEIYQASINTLFLAYLNSQRPPFNNADLRRAVNLALDRQELVAKTLEGAGVPCAILDPKLVGDFALPLEEVNKMPGCRQPKDADVAEAKRLVEKHHPGGLDIEIATRAVGNYVDRAQVVIAQLRKIGIRGTLKTHESAAGYAAWGKGDFTLIATQDRSMDVNDPSGVFHIAYTTGSGSNYGRMSDPKVDELAERALKESNHDKRKQLYWELQRYILTRGDAASIAVGWVEGWFFKDKRLRNYKPGLTTYDNNTFMKVWLAQ